MEILFFCKSLVFQARFWRSEACGNCVFLQKSRVSGRFWAFRNMWKLCFFARVSWFWPRFGVQKISKTLRNSARTNANPMFNKSRHSFGTPHCRRKHWLPALPCLFSRNFEHRVCKSLVLQACVERAEAYGKYCFFCKRVSCFTPVSVFRNMWKF